MSASTSQFLSKFHSLFNNKKACTKKLVFISSIWDDDCINRLDEITGNVYGVVKHSKESMLLIILLKYWERGVCILKVVINPWKSPPNKTPRASEFQSCLEGCYSGLFQKIKAYILSLQNKSSAVIKSTIHRISKSITTSNNTNVSEMLSFSYA